MCISDRLPWTARRLAAVIAGGPALPIWPVRADGRLFVVAAGAGFDADVIARVSDRLKARFGKLAFVWAILMQVWHYRACAFVVRSADGAVYRAASVVIANGRFYAGRFVLAREARVADPGFHIVLIHRGGRLAALRYLAAMTIGMLDRLPDVMIVPAQSAVLESAGPARLEADGELAAWLPLTVEVAGDPLLLVYPARV